MAKKVWKISDFSGGLNNYTNSYDLKSNEFVEFQDVTSTRKGVLQPLGNSERIVEFPVVNTTYNPMTQTSIIGGAGLHTYNVNYKYFPAQPNQDLEFNWTNISDSVTGYGHTFFWLGMKTCTWQFKTAYPTSGTLYLQAKVDGVPIMEKLEMASGHWLDTAQTNANKFNDKVVTLNGHPNNNYRVYDSETWNVGVQAPYATVPYDPTDLIIHGIPGYGSGDGVDKAVTMQISETHHYLTHNTFERIAPSAWGHIHDGNMLEFDSDQWAEIPHSTFMWFSDDYKALGDDPDSDFVSVYELDQGWFDCAINDKRYCLGWDGTSATTANRRFAVGPGEFSGPTRGYDGYSIEDGSECFYYSYDSEGLLFQNLISYNSWNEAYWGGDRPSTTYWPSSNWSWMISPQYGLMYTMNPNEFSVDQVVDYARYNSYKVMMRSIHSNIIQAINNYNGTILTVDDATPSHTAWEASQTHTNITGVSNGSGTGLTCNITTNGAGASGFTIVTGGTGYEVDEEITFTDPGSTSNTAVLVVATLGGVSDDDSFTAEFWFNHLSEFVWGEGAGAPLSQPHLINADVANSFPSEWPDWTALIKSTQDNFPSELSGFRNLEIHLTSANLACDGNYIDGTGEFTNYNSGTPVQIPQYTLVDTGINTTQAINTTDTSIFIPANKIGHFMLGDIIAINDGSDPEIMKITEIIRGDVGFGDDSGDVEIWVSRGSPDYYGTTLKSSYPAQNVPHSTGADIYKESIGMMDPEAIYSETLGGDDLIQHEVDLLKTIPMTGIRNAAERCLSLQDRDNYGTPGQKALTLYGWNTNNDNFEFEFRLFNQLAVGGNQWTPPTSEDPYKITVSGATSSLDDIYGSIERQIGNIKKVTGDDLIAGIDNIAVASQGAVDDPDVDGRKILVMYFVSVDTDTSMVVAGDGTGYVPSVPPNYYSEVIIQSGMDNFTVGDYITWQEAGAGGSNKGLSEIAQITWKSSSSSAGGIRIKRGVTYNSNVTGSTRNTNQTIYSNNVLYKVNRSTELYFNNQWTNVSDYDITDSTKFMGDDFFHVFLSETSDISVNTNLDSGNTAYKINFKLFSTLLNTWVKTDDNIEGFNMSEQLDWIYSDTPSDKCSPVLFSEAGRLRLADGNFNLDNRNKIFEYINIVDHFKDLPGSGTAYSSFEYPANVLKHGYGMFDNEVSWNNTVIDSKVSISAIRGLLVSNDATAVSNAVAANFTSEFGRMYVKIIKNSSTTTGVDWSGRCRFYATKVYSDGSETLPVHKFDTDVDFADGEDAPMTDSLNVEVYFRPVDNEGNLTFGSQRVSAIKLYYTNEADNFIAYNLLGTIDFQRGFLKASSVRNVDDSSGINASYVWKDHSASTNALQIWNVEAGSSTIVYDNMPVEETYNNENLVKPSEAINLKARYKTITMAGKRAFIGNVLIETGNDKLHIPDGMIVSPIDKLDVFPYPSNLLELDISDGGNITALASMGDKVLQFKDNMLYIINITSNIEATFFIEERHKFKGAADKNHVCETSEGIFWFNTISAYFYNGTDIVDLLVKEGDEDEANSRRIHPKEWKGFINKKSMAGFNPESHEFFIVRSYEHSLDKDTGDCYVYNNVSKNWALGKHKFWAGGASGVTLTNLEQTVANGLLTSVWTVSNGVINHVFPVETSGNGRGLVLGYATDSSGNPVFQIENNGFGYKAGDKVIFQDPLFVVTSSNTNTIPTAILEIATSSGKRYITNFTNIGPEGKLSYYYEQKTGNQPGPDGDGSPL